MAILKSKKAQAGIVGIVLVIVNQLYPLLDENTINEIVTVILVYIGSQGIADFGKSKALIDNVPSKYT